ncbi:hypothetical protein NHX12_011148 [Muraenolepis orangiensis]|uniref:J domain-containing protein n=1 Tax=Muraenolepis orangiensis TaxID=630683 RepID=A0A9Q0DH49_9TELE|nr:hypothetical protein NHX12_011148 [Muraenolepis orangiensis]
MSRRCLWCYRSGLRRLSLSSVNRMPVSHYELLGVKPSATLTEIKKAYFDKSKKLHPDRDPSNEALHGQFVELSEAYRVLSREPSRKAYDSQRRTPRGGGGGGRASASNIYTSSAPFGASEESRQNARYWEQFRQAPPQDMTSEESQQQKRRRDFRLVGYCVLAMLLSAGAHFIFFRKLEEVHSNIVREKTRIITEIYEQSKERARVNGFKKQTEILREKHAAFMEKYNLPTGDGGKEK